MKKIIFVDRIRQSMDYGLFEELAGFEVLTAYSNADALRIHGKEKASLIITELYGSGMGGAQFCAHIRGDAELRDVSIILCCRDNEIERREAAQCRANAVLTLPVSGNALRRKIDELLSISARGTFHGRFTARTKATSPAVIDCRIENISATGMLIRADAELRRGDLLLYSLDLPAARSFPVQAEVVRTEGGRYGVRFAGLAPAAQRAIEALVSASPSAR